MNVAVGTEVIIWTRMREDVVVLLGEGVYEGVNYIHGQPFPVVKLVDGREATIHQSGIAVGTKDSVARTCAAFPGVKIAFDFAAYVSGKRPTEEEIARLSQTSGAKAVQLPEPKTVTDRLMYLKKEIELEENKKKMFQQQIDECDKKIVAKKQEALALRDSVMKELESLGITGATVAAAPAVVEPVEPTAVRVIIEGEEHANPLQPLPAESVFDAEAKRAAIED